MEIIVKIGPKIAKTVNKNETKQNFEKKTRLRGAYAHLTLQNQNIEVN